jgi:hypothetical protein
MTKLANLNLLQVIGLLVLLTVITIALVETA